MFPEADVQSKAPPERFTTTHWSVVLACADSQAGDRTARNALAQLCQTYWRPIFAFVCRSGHSVPDAQDLTQDFFVMVLEGHLLERANPNRGRFRSLLLKALKDFLNDARDKSATQKRGGKVAFVSWDDWMSQSSSELSISAQAFDSLPPERIFDLRWACTVVEQALGRLREECEAKGRLRLFDALSCYLVAERDEVHYADLATVLGATKSVVKKQLHNLRERYRWLLRDEVARTVADSADVEDEIRHLCAALAASTQ